MERFLDAYFYVAKQLVTQQEFDIRVWRAAVSDEDRKELIAVQRVHWGDRRPAPRDLCNMAKDGLHEDAIMNFLSDVVGNTANDRLEQFLQTPYRGLPKLEEGLPAHDGPVTKSTAVGHIFTRNEVDGFVNEEELTPEVDPPQEPTPLHLNTVYGRNFVNYESKDQKKKKKPTQGASDAPNNQHNQNAAFYIMFANGHAKFHADRSPSWKGDEHVLMTLRETSDGQFIAEPSLNEYHVLSVAEDVIISYQINVAEHHRHHKTGAGKSDPAPDGLTNQGSMSSFEAQVDDTQRKTAILRQLVASAAGPALTTGGAATAAVPGSTFTVPPNRRDQHRVHFFGTINQVRTIEHNAVFVDCEFVLPEAGYTIDSDVNHKCGVTHHARFLSQTALASRFLDENLMYTTAHNINLPFELHCIADAVTPVTPRLVVAVWSAEGDKKQTLQGYGLVTLSPTPGQCSQEVQLWRPTLHGHESLQSLFVGGSASLVNIEDAGIPYRRRADNLRAICDTIDFNSKEAGLAINNRAGLNTESCGSITVSWMCVTQRRYTKSDDAMPNRFAKSYHV